MSLRPLVRPRVGRPGVHRLLGRLAAGPPSAGEPRRLLVLKPDHLGDVLLAGPALHAVRSRFPDAVITLAVGPWGAEAARRLPGVDHVLIVQFPGFERADRQSVLARWLLLARLARRWRGRFDAGLVLRDDFYWGAMLLAALRLPLRAGTATPSCAPFLTRAAPPGRRAVAAQHLRVADLLSGDDPGSDHWTPERPLRFQPHNASPEAAAALARSGLTPTTPYVLLHPGAGAAVKLWTGERWAAVLREIQEQCGLRALVVAGPAEADLIPPILRLAPGAVTPVQPLGLDLLAALMQHARLVLGVDSGPLHLAAALDVPSVRLYGPIDPLVYGPWADPRRHRWVASRMLCAPCDRLDWDRLALPWHPCVRRLEPAEVLRAALEALEAGRNLTP